MRRWWGEITSPNKKTRSFADIAFANRKSQGVLGEMLKEDTKKVQMLFHRLRGEENIIQINGQMGG